jgi:hypothetical protein
MGTYSKIIFFFCVVTFSTSCSLFKSSMSPTELYDTLPTYTNATFMTANQVQNSNCILLTENRSYTAPIGPTVKGDLKNGAKGIDEWVELDGGNAYVVKDFHWMTVAVDPQSGGRTTQLYIEFDTYVCN